MQLTVQIATSCLLDCIGFTQSKQQFCSLRRKIISLKIQTCIVFLKRMLEFPTQVKGTNPTPQPLTPELSVISSGSTFFFVFLFYPKLTLFFNHLIFYICQIKMNEKKAAKERGKGRGIFQYV